MKRALTALATLSVVVCFAAPQTVVEWTFDESGDAKEWSTANHVSNVRVADGALKGTLMDWDPWVTSPQFEIKADTWQRVEFRLRTTVSGTGQLFFTSTTKSPYGGFFPRKNVSWRVNGDGQWHDYSILPFWQSEKKIIMIRLDFARVSGADKGVGTFELDWLRIVQAATPGRLAKPPQWRFPADVGALSPSGLLTARRTKGGLGLVAANRDDWLESSYFSFPADDAFFAVVRMSTKVGRTASLSWLSGKAKSRAVLDFAVIPDGLMRTYNLDLSSSKTWSDDIHRVGFRPPLGKGESTLAELVFAEDPSGPPSPFPLYAGLEEAINRAGRSASFLVSLENRGGETMVDARIKHLRLPLGVSAVKREGWDRIGAIDVFDRLEHRFQLLASGPVSGPFELVVEGGGARCSFTGELKFEASLSLPKADYVPIPHPVESDYEIGALYFPGWPTIDRWARIWATDPQRRPVLGWYDEANPEVVDWQIKWAVENGIQFFMVDWYWNKGSMHLEHWIRAWEKARYRSYLKWCMMYANHNPKGSHSEEDQRNVTKYWIDNFFHLAEYYRIDGKPVVMYWSPAGLKRDMGEGAGGAKKLLDISREMAREAGYKGIHFIAMKWPEASTRAGDVQWLKDEGFDMTSLYHFMHHGGKAENPRRFPFKLVADCSYEWWQARRETGILPFMPNLSTGWHSRPWHHDKGTWIEGRTVADFRRICADARKFADETGIRRMVLAPINEWGEGSYAEPNTEFGFGMYESVRDAFCRKPLGGWPANYGPSDVGLGPYDLPKAKRNDLTHWTFAGDAQGWRAAMGIQNFKGGGGSLRFRTSSNDPALSTSLGRIRARNYRRVVVRMKTAPSGPGEKSALQLFWSTNSASISETTSASVAIQGDGEFHEYAIEVAENPRWRGRLKSFRLDPGSHRDVVVEITEIRLQK
ncbi:MAG: glycoside hydrolase family 99-like domain-containing protein [Lentisphaeria bacterium]|nr:glycoside hydrolase family 99-like domain-containing protein [Lentisphaeria bacterium]